MGAFLPHQVIDDLAGAQENFDAIDGSVLQVGQNLADVLSASAARTNLGLGFRGAVNISASESRTNTAFGTLTTPDQVTGVVLPANGLIAVWYQATWKESVNTAARAAIFLGSNEVKVAVTNTPSGAEAFTNSAGTNTNLSLASSTEGLQSGIATGYTGDVTTGQVVGVSGSAIGPVGGPCYIFAAAGTYTVSVQFKASSGSVTASNRQLWVEAKSFA